LNGSWEAVVAPSTIFPSTFRLVADDEGWAIGTAGDRSALYHYQNVNWTQYPSWTSRYHAIQTHSHPPYGRSELTDWPDAYHAWRSTRRQGAGWSLPPSPAHRPRQAPRSGSEGS